MSCDSVSPSCQRPSVFQTLKCPTKQRLLFLLGLGLSVSKESNDFHCQEHLQDL